MNGVIPNTLRQASEPITTREIAFRVMKERAIDTNNPPLLKLITKRVGVALRAKRDQGVLRSEQGPGRFNLWELVRNQSATLAPQVLLHVDPRKDQCKGGMQITDIELDQLPHSKFPTPQIGAQANLQMEN